ncbi:TetR/AcrR family transcriptional regulator [Actinomadura nitritigenes]|uniref:TetR/AcrR family transcriptional regulator n=1 Tax=Actinomadura nitritigenes TaxID=134602 RepID=UPI003D8C74BD
MSADNREVAEVSESLRGIASRLFAEIGYDGTTIDMLISAGASRQEVAAAGGKSGLYRAVMEDLLKRRCRALEAVLADASPGLEGFSRLADAFLDFNLENPTASALWTHRSLHDAADFSDLESRFIAPVARMMIDNDHGRTLPTAPEMQLATIGWCVMGFLTRGLFNADGSTSGAEDPDTVSRFREHLHQLIRFMNTP